MAIGATPPSTNSAARAAARIALPTVLLLSACEHAKLLRPNVLKQLDTDVAALVNELPDVDHPDKATVARLFAHGGLSHAKAGPDGVFRDRIYVPTNEYVWQPAIVVMPRAGELELEFHNNDESVHIAFLPNSGDRETLILPMKSGGRARIRLDQPGLYWFGCPVANHAGRGMLGLVIVEGEITAEAKLDRPRQRRP